MKREKINNGRLSAYLMIITGIVLVMVAFYYYTGTMARIEERRLQIEREKEILVQELETHSEDVVEQPEPKEERSFLPNTLGFLEIEKLEVTLPIFPDATRKSLRDGVGVIETTDAPSSEMNTTSAIAGHRGGYNAKQTFFKIDTLKSGDLIKVITADGELVYAVTGSEVIEPTDWSKFGREEDKSKLILMTCHPYPVNNKRLLVYSELVEVN